MDELFLKRMSLYGNSFGSQIRNHSNIMMDKFFKNDADYYQGILYDRDMNPLETVDYKFQFTKEYSINKDQVEYLVQFRPSFHPEKKYIESDGKERLGFYLDVPDNTGQIYKWLLVGRNNKSFTRYNVLLCNYTFKYIINGVIKSTLGVLRDRNNYNSGVWSDSFTTTVQNQTQFLVPTNSTTLEIDYDDRYMLSDNRIHPLVYKVTKRVDAFPFGVTKITLAQDHYNATLDNPNLGICNYYDSKIPPVTEEKIETNIKLSYTGLNRMLYMGGSKKTITAAVYDSKSNLTGAVVSWSYKLNNKTVVFNDIASMFYVSIDGNIIVIQALDTANYGDVLSVIATSNGESNEIELEVRR